MNGMVEELLEHLVNEKMDCKEYKELSEETDNVELKTILLTMASDEHKHYELIRDFIAKLMD